MNRIIKPTHNNNKNNNSSSIANKNEDIDIKPSIIYTIRQEEEEKVASVDRKEMEWEKLEVKTANPDNTTNTSPLDIQGKVAHMFRSLRRRKVVGVPKPGSTIVKIIHKKPRQTPPPRQKPSIRNNDISDNNNDQNTFNEPPVDHKSSFVAVLPHILSGYLQLILNILIISAISFLLFKLWVVLQHDIDLRAEQHAIDIDQENKMCAKEYITNKCDDRVPALEERCLDWDKYPILCVGNAIQLILQAETIADTINHLVEPISYKTMVFFGALFSIFMLVTNLGLRFGAHKPESHPPPPIYPLPPSFYPQSPSITQSPANSPFLISNAAHTPHRPQDPYDSPYKRYSGGSKAI